MIEIERCPKCNGVLAIIGRAHNCRPAGAPAKPQPAAPKSKARVGVKRLGSRGPAPGAGGRPRKGEEGKTLQAQKPWEAEGISQATWYRRKRGK